jgi:elongation factor P
MVIASELREGMVLRIEEQIYKVMEVESKAGAAKMGGVVKTKLINVCSGRMWSRTSARKKDWKTWSSSAARWSFCTLKTILALSCARIPSSKSRSSARSLDRQQGFWSREWNCQWKFLPGEPIRVVLPDIAEARVATTAPPSRSEQDSAWKEATLDNGLAIRVPLFIAPGETVRVDVKTGRYVERARAERKRSA